MGPCQSAPWRLENSSEPLLSITTPLTTPRLSPPTPPAGLSFFPQATVDRLLGEEPLLRRNYLRYLSGRIRFLSGRLQSVTQSGSEGKLARYLLANAVDGPVNISATDLARQLGLSRASLYRAFDALEQADLIRRSGKTIEVPSLPALQSVL